jgi:hypothetical protein
MHRHEAEALISEDLVGNPALLGACLAILEFISATPATQLQHITFGMLRQAAGLDRTGEIFPAVVYLSGARVPLLTPFFELIDGGQPEHLSLEEVEEARRDMVLFNPRTGEVVEDFEHKLYMHFLLSDEGQQVAGKA